MPRASLACTVIVDVVVPSAVTDAGETDIVDCAAEAVPAVKVTDPESVIGCPFNVPDIVVTSEIVFEIVAE